MGAELGGREVSIGRARPASLAATITGRGGGLSAGKDNVRISIVALLCFAAVSVCLTIENIRIRFRFRLLSLSLIINKPGFLSNFYFLYLCLNPASFPIYIQLPSYLTTTIILPFFF